MSYRNILIYNRILKRKVIGGIISQRDIHWLLRSRLLRGGLLVHRLLRLLVNRLLRLETGP